MAFDITPYIHETPAKVRELIRQGVIDFPTAGMCAGYAQANLAILPPEYAADFEEYTRKNPFPCPVLEIVRGTPETHAMGEGASIVTDIPRYRVYENGVFTKELTDVSEYWKEGYVGFLIGCSFSFEEALIAAGIEVRHIAQGCNVPMYKTNIATAKAGPFEGPMVCSMRPMTPENAEIARQITAAMPNVHGAPVHMGDPAAIGVAAHEAGHAVQYAQGYGPIKLRAAIIPITNIGSKLAMPLILIGLLLTFAENFSFFFVYLGIACFGLSLVFQLVTLPVEFNASRRAMVALEEGGILTDEERKGAKKTLKAAALTYVAATATALAQLLRLILIFGGRRRRD